MIIVPDLLLVLSLSQVLPRDPTRLVETTGDSITPRDFRTRRVLDRTLDLLTQMRNDGPEPGSHWVHGEKSYGRSPERRRQSYIYENGRTGLYRCKNSDPETRSSGPGKTLKGEVPRGVRPTLVVPSCRLRKEVLRGRLVPTLLYVEPCDPGFLPYVCATITDVITGT